VKKAPPIQQVVAMSGPKAQDPSLGRGKGTGAGGSEMPDFSSSRRDAESRRDGPVPEGKASSF